MLGCGRGRGRGRGHGRCLVGVKKTPTLMRASLSLKPKAVVCGLTITLKFSGSGIQREAKPRMAHMSRSRTPCFSGPLPAYPASSRWMDNADARLGVLHTGPHTTLPWYVVPFRVYVIWSELMHWAALTSSHDGSACCGRCAMAVSNTRSSHATDFLDAVMPAFCVCVCFFSDWIKKWMDALWFFLFIVVDRGSSKLLADAPQDMPWRVRLLGQLPA